MKLSEIPAAGLRKCAAPPVAPESTLHAKARFTERLAQVGLADKSIGWLAHNIFGVPKSTLSERVSSRRTDLAPLAEWFDRLDEYESFRRLARKFEAVG